jgi:TPR repeat protein
MHYCSSELIALAERVRNEDTDAEYELGQILYFGRYVFGEFVTQDTEKGFELISKAAKKKHPDAVDCFNKLAPQIKAARKARRIAEFHNGLSEIFIFLLFISVSGIIILGIVGLLMLGLRQIF